MAHGDISTAWDEVHPDDDNYGHQLDDFNRLLRTQLREGLAAEHNWPNTGTALFGIHKRSECGIALASDTGTIAALDNRTGAVAFNTGAGTIDMNTGAGWMAMTTEGITCAYGNYTAAALTDPTKIVGLSRDPIAVYLERVVTSQLFFGTKISDNLYDVENGNVEGVFLDWSNANELWITAGGNVNKDTEVYEFFILYGGEDKSF